MFVLTAKLSRKRLFLAGVLVLFLAAAAALIFHLFSGLRDSGDALPRLSDNQQRLEYLASYGWEVEAEPLETFQLLLADPLPEEYLAYNQLQLTQGFDLNSCCGKQLTRYTYRITNYPGRPTGVQVNLYVCEGLPAAGDVIASGAGGFQAGLAFPETDRAG
ncbi:DUF4830 domain-containing protein [Dysosmobacter sp.]|uniref:DUF4830 domain-containing protein n=1 Tax=Dysosmobacter sp. TaxID=2591382 RepID=UPI002A8F5D94|nr:DUF4830 domain-containing protein [Dysosmobacter sp.]MDY3281358.1 DUF4830 domain-containing protein [Dysosmobacter sp.]